MTLPKVNSYGQYSSSNYGAHCLCFSFGSVEVYFSYRTVVGFYSPSTGLILSENLWGPTTGKHLNWISRTAPRLKRDEFEAKVAAALAERNIEGVSL